MRIAQEYSHLNGEEYLLVHHKKLYGEIKKIISSIDADIYKTKKSKEARKQGKTLYSPKAINTAFKDEFRDLGWNESRYSYYITTNRQLMLESINIPFKQQKQFLLDGGEKTLFIHTTKQILLKIKSQWKFSLENIHLWLMTYL